MQADHTGKELEKQLEAIGHIESAEAPPFLYEKIRQRMQQRREAMLNPATAWKIAAGIFFLLALNCYTFFGKQGIHHKTGKPGTVQSTPLNDYFPSNTIDY